MGRSLTGSLLTYTSLVFPVSSEGVLSAGEKGYAHTHFVNFHFQLTPRHNKHLTPVKIAGCTCLRVVHLPPRSQGTPESNARHIEGLDVLLLGT